MIYPAIESLMKKTDSRYSLVVATAKRARELLDGTDALVESSSNKQVAVAIDEIYNNKIEIIYQPVKKQAEEEDDDEEEENV